MASQFDAQQVGAALDQARSAVRDGQSDPVDEALVAMADMVERYLALRATWLSECDIDDAAVLGEMNQIERKLRTATAQDRRAVTPAHIEKAIGEERIARALRDIEEHADSPNGDSSRDDGTKEHKK